MSTEIKPGQVWAWNDGRTGPGPEITVTSLGEYVGGDARVNYAYSGDLDVFDVDLASFQKKAHLVTDVDATPTPSLPTQDGGDDGSEAAPLDPKSVHVGDTVTVRFKETGDEIVTKAYQPDDITRPSEWVYLLGFPLHRPDGSLGLAFSYFEILAIEPAVVPNRAPGTTGTATVLDTPGVRVMRTDGTVNGVDIAWVSAVHVAGSRMHHAPQITDFVPDEPRPLPTREHVAEAIMATDKATGNYGLYPDVATKAADAVLALLRGESR